MLKRSILLVLFLVGLVYAIPELDRSLGVSFVPVPEGGYDEARKLAVDFLNNYLDEYALGDTEPLLGYDCGMDYIGFAFIIATRLDKISWSDYYSWNKEYLEHFEGVTQLFIDNPSLKPELSDPYLSVFTKLKELEDNFFVLTIGFIESGPVVLSCTSIPASFNYKNTYPSFSTDDPQINRIDYIILMRDKEMSASVEPTNLYYIYQYIEIEDEYFVNGKPLNYPFFKDSKPLYFPTWSIYNFFNAADFSSLDIPPQDHYELIPVRTFKQKYLWDCFFATKCMELGYQIEQLYFNWDIDANPRSTEEFQTECYDKFIDIFHTNPDLYVWGSGEIFYLSKCYIFNYIFKMIFSMVMILEKRPRHRPDLSALCPTIGPEEEEVVTKYLYDGHNGLLGKDKG